MGHEQYLLSSVVEYTGIGAGKLDTKRMQSLTMLLPSLDEQDEIVTVAKALDDRITLLRETNATLEAIAQALFKSWFVDFDPVRAKMEGRTPEGMDEATAALFPDGFETSELGVVPRGWMYCSLKEVCSIFDSKRVPLSGAERAKRRGPYPYYGAAALMDYVDEYLFDGIYLLTGEDGSVADEQGFPITQYVWGKFWVNNHAHILQGKAGFSTEHLALALRRVNIQPYITGAVQAKLSQSNMWRINVLHPGQGIAEAFWSVDCAVIRGSAGKRGSSPNPLLPPRHPAPPHDLRPAAPARSPGRHRGRPGRCAVSMNALFLIAACACSISARAVFYFKCLVGLARWGQLCARPAGAAWGAGPQCSQRRTRAAASLTLEPAYAN